MPFINLLTKFRLTVSHLAGIYSKALIFIHEHIFSCFSLIFYFGIISQENVMMNSNARDKIRMEVFSMKEFVPCMNNQKNYL